MALTLDGRYHGCRQVRNRKRNEALIQGVETARAVLETTPQGQAADAQFVSSLVSRASFTAKQVGMLLQIGRRMVNLLRLGFRSAFVLFIDLSCGRFIVENKVFSDYLVNRLGDRNAIDS